MHMKGKQEKGFGRSRCKTIKSEEAKNSTPLSSWGRKWRRQRLSKVLGHLHRIVFRALPSPRMHAGEGGSWGYSKGLSFIPSQSIGCSSATELYSQRLCVLSFWES